MTEREFNALRIARKWLSSVETHIYDSDNFKRDLANIDAALSESPAPEMGKWTDDDRARAWREAFDSMHQRAMTAEAKVTEVERNSTCDTSATVEPLTWLSAKGLEAVTDRATYRVYGVASDCVILEIDGKRAGKGFLSAEDACDAAFTDYVRRLYRRGMKNV